MGIPIEHLEHLRVTNENRTRNFPIFREVRGLKETSKKMGINFADIMRELYGMGDTFGLCGIISVHASSILTTGYGKDFRYSPRKYKEIFEDAVANGKPRAYDVFAREYFPNKTFEELAVTDAGQMRHTLRNLRPNQGLLINLMCHYPKQNGEHTHYLAAKSNGDDVMLVGDLSPFGLQSVGISLPTETLVAGMRQVIGADLTTNIADKILELNQQFGDGKEEKRQQYNVSVQNF